MSPPATLPEADARAVRRMIALEASPAEAGAWTEDDRRRADEAARRVAGAGAALRDLAVARARHVVAQPAARAPRDAAARLRGRGPVLLALGLALAGGVLADAAGPGQRIDLLSPPFLAVLGWNLAVYAVLGARALATPATPDPLRRLDGRRVAVLLHAGAAALALGLCIGLYARGLVLDYRAGWQSTFLDAAQVHALLSTLLAPASLATGIALPTGDEVAALRVPAGAAAQGAAADWIHLFAATLVLGVVLPRALLAIVAAWRMRRLAAAVPVDFDTPYFHALARRLRGDAAPAGLARVLPHAMPAPEAQRLALALGAAMPPTVAPTVAFGAESAAAPPPGEGALHVLVPLAATPEAEHHGVLLDRLRAASPALLVDESGYVARFAHDPARIDERRAAWRAFAEARGVDVRFIDLGAG